MPSPSSVRIVAAQSESAGYLSGERELAGAETILRAVLGQLGDLGLLVPSLHFLAEEHMLAAIHSGPIEGSVVRSAAIVVHPQPSRWLAAVYAVRPKVSGYVGVVRVVH